MEGIFAKGLMVDFRQELQGAHFQTRVQVIKL